MKGKAIIQAAMKRHRIGPKDFFGSSRLAHIVRVRRIATRRLLDAGFTKAAASRLMKRNWTTIRYHADADLRAKQSSYYRNYNGARRASAELAA